MFILLSILVFLFSFCDLTKNPVYITCDEYLKHRTAISSEWLNKKKKSLDLSKKSYTNSRYPKTISKFPERLNQDDIIQKRKGRGVTLEIGSALQVRMTLFQMFVNFILVYVFNIYMFISKIFHIHLQDLFRELIAENRALYPTTTQNDTNTVQSVATYTTAMEYSRLGQ